MAAMRVHVRYSSGRGWVLYPRLLGEVPNAESGSPPMSQAGPATLQRHKGGSRGFLLCLQDSDCCRPSFEVYFYSSETHHSVKG